MIRVTVIVTLVLFFKIIWPKLKSRITTAYNRLQQKRKKLPAASLFDDSYIDANSLYLNRFNSLPSISFVRSLDSTRAFEWVKAEFDGKITALYQRNYYDWDEKKQLFYRTLFELNNRIIIELSQSYAQVLYNQNQCEEAGRILSALVQFEEAEKENEFEINIITLSSGNLELKRLDIKPTLLDLDLYYNDDFREVDAVVRERLGRKNDKGIVLLHGLPGTGKTTYLRHLIGSLNKKVLFVSPSVAGNLMNPEFIDLLIEHPNSVLIIEDAENIIMDRRHNSTSSVSNLLNISDGLLSDCLNVQIICTFNSGLDLVDSALMRKGRLIAKYAFGKLEVEKARRLSAHLGLQQEISRPMTLADIANSQEKDQQPVVVNVIGFRRSAEVLEN